MPKKDSKNQKKSIGIKETLAGADTSLMEKQLKEQIEAPMVRLSYTYAMDVVQAKLKMINADLTEQFDRQVKHLSVADVSCRLVYNIITNDQIRNQINHK